MPQQRDGHDDGDLGIDWLAAQLGADAASEAGDAGDEQSEGAPEPAAESRPDAGADPAPTVAMPVAPSAAAPTPAAPPAAAPASAAPPVAPPAASPVTPPAVTFPSAPSARPADSPAAQPALGTPPATSAADAAEKTPDAGGFRWGLTPTTEPDPAVGAARRNPLASGRAAAGRPSPGNDDTAVTPVTPARPASAVPAAPVPAAAPPASATPAAPVPAAAPPAAATPPAPVPAAPAPSAAPAPVSAARSVPPAALNPEQPLTKPPAAPRRNAADLEPAPWWTTPAQARLAPTDEEAAAAVRRRSSAIPPSPLGTAAVPDGVASGAAAPPLPQPRSAHAAPPRSAEPPAGPPAALPVAAVATDSHAVPADEKPSERQGRRAGAGGSGGIPPRRILIGAAGFLLAVLVIVGLFFLGQNLGGTPVAAPTESAASATPTPTPTETTPPAAVAAPQPAGVHAWDTMFGTECLEPYTSPWDQEFTVVDCAAPHTAQLVYRGTLEGDAAAPFPGEEAFAAQINVLCSAPGVIDFEAAAAYGNVQLQGSYPVTAEQWAAGERYYYCFASRSSGEPLTASLAPAA